MYGTPRETVHRTDCDVALDRIPMRATTWTTTKRYVDRKTRAKCTITHSYTRFKPHATK